MPINHRYDADDFIARMPANASSPYHIAGHYDEDIDLKIDTHGAPVKADVWRLLENAYRRFGVRPTLLERDFNFPPMQELLAETNRIRMLQNTYTDRQRLEGVAPCMMSCANSNSGWRATCATRSGMPPPAGIEERRLRVYRELFFNAIESLLANSFP